MKLSEICRAGFSDHLDMVYVAVAQLLMTQFKMELFDY